MDNDDFKWSEAEWEQQISDAVDAGAARMAKCKPGTSKLIPQTPKPPSVRCANCGRDCERKWVEPRRDGRGFWNMPMTAPCEHCKHRPEDDAQRLNERQRRAGMPLRMRGWDTENRLAMTTTPGEDYIAEELGFKLSLRDSNKSAKVPVLGVTEQDRAELLPLLNKWLPPMGSVFLCGPVGSGKSVTAAAICNRLLKPQPMVAVERPDEDFKEWKVQPGPATRMAFKVSQSWQVKWTSEDELWERETLSWSGDKDPKKRLSDAPVLFIDDLGTVTNGKAIEMMQRLIRRRYDLQLTTFFTSNLHWTELARGNGIHPGYGERIADRIHEMCRGERPRLIEMQCVASWRRLDEQLQEFMEAQR